MLKAVGNTIGKVKTLSEERQRHAAEVLELIAAAGPIALSWMQK